MKSKIKIVNKHGYDDCEDCGSYDWEDVNVYLNGNLVLWHTGDNHLGGGVWYEWKDAVSTILTALGYEVDYEENLDEIQE